MYLLIFFVLLLVAGGTVGALKTGDNLALAQKKQLLKAEQKHMQAISRTVAKIEREENAIHDLLGLRDRERPRPSENTGN